MSIETGTINLCDGFSKPEKIPLILDAIKQIDADVMTFPEAWREGSDQHLDAVEEDLDKLGYRVARQLYNDDDGRRDRHGLIMIGRQELTLESWPVRLAGRTALQLVVYDEQAAASIDVLGLHLDDRLEITRIEQVMSLLDYLAQLWSVVEQRPVVLEGDLNAMKDGVRAYILRVIGYVANLLPQLEPGTPKPESMLSMEGLHYALPRVASLYSRLGGMATGDVMKLLEMHSFHDDGRWHKPTATNNFPIAELDHIMAMNAEVSDYARVPNNFTDHWGVKGTISQRHI